MADKTVKTTAEGKPKRTRDLILEHAFKLVSREGLAGLTLGELAKAVGMSKSGLFAHFAAKDKLQLTILELVVDQFVTAVLKPAFKEPRGLPRVRAIFDLWIHYLNDHERSPGGTILIAASTELDDRPGPLRDFVQQSQQELIHNLMKAIQMAIDEGHFRKDLDVKLFASRLYSYVLGYHHFKRMLHDPEAESQMRRSFEELLNGATLKPVS
jgi:AcrR family transcriptional regulator